MKFKLDENLPAEIAALIAPLGHDVDTVEAEGLNGHPDDDIVGAAAAEQRILLTLDKGIANIRRYPASVHVGIVLFRPSATGRGVVLEFIQACLPELLALPLEGRLAVVSRDGIRIR